MHDVVTFVLRKKWFLFLFTLGLLFSSAELQASDPVNGRKLYMQHCNSCHEPGKEMAGAPDFSYGSTLMQSDPVLLRKIRTGKNAMPGYIGIMSDRMILDIIAYMRTF
ncbi:MAG TPA: cytochrome c [Gammaproteobacteria bacterium]|nr:cytochrome c [Gammaproteobacteria bacterium]